MLAASPAPKPTSARHDTDRVATTFLLSPSAMALLTASSLSSGPSLASVSAVGSLLVRLSLSNRGTTGTCAVRATARMMLGNIRVLLSFGFYCDWRESTRDHSLKMVP